MPPRLLSQCISSNKRAALTEIIDVLRAVCHAHRLPLALTWIPCCYSEGIGDETERIRIKEGHTSSNEKCVLCIEESACYINDRAVGGFVHGCIENHLEEGQGLAGNALQTNHPFFSTDVKTFDISEYPLVHHARKYNLNAAVAFRLRSTYTNDDDYVLEFFLPVNMTGSSEQHVLLDNLSGAMWRICRSLRTVSDAELTGIEAPKLGFQRQKSQAMNGSRKQVEMKRSPVEKNVSLSVLQQYFSGAISDDDVEVSLLGNDAEHVYVLACDDEGFGRDWQSAGQGGITGDDTEQVAVSDLFPFYHN
ncbi:NLP9 protein [Spatholobus suberectus]|nr:NLP9 protein [Spatholobus suberectus]